MAGTTRILYIIIMTVAIVIRCATSIPVKRAADKKAPYFTSPQKMARRFVAEPSGADTSVRFHCHADGTPMPDIEWLKNGQPLNAGNIRYEKVRIRTWTLMLKDLQPQDSGFYTCVVSNEYGSINATYQLEVIARVVHPPRLKPGLPQDKTVFVGDDVTLRCEVMNTGFLPHMQWMKQVTQKQIEQGDAVFETVKTEWPTRPDWTCEQMTKNLFEEHPYECIERDFTDELNVDPNKLQLLNVSVEDSGRYTCLAGNAIGIAYRSASLKVRKLPLAPVFTEQLETHITAYKGADIRLKCPVKGTPRPDIIWSKEGVPIPLDSKNNKMLQTRQSVRIINTLPEDAGTYSCFASNEHGQLWANFTVIVQDKPEKGFMMDGSEERKLDTTKNKTMLSPAPPQFISPERMSHELTKTVGSHVRLRCNAEGSPIPDIQWLKDGHEIIIDKETGDQVHHEQQKKWILSLENTKLGDAGMYTCIVSNTLGSINMTFQLTVRPSITMKPGLPKNTTATVGTTASFKCDVIGKHVAPHILWLRHMETATHVDDVIQKIKNLWLNHPDWPCDDIVTELFEAERPVICLPQPPVDVTSTELYQKKLYISDVDFDDVAMYTCLVFNNSNVVGHGSAWLSVTERELSTAQPTESLVFDTVNSTSPEEPTRHFPQTLPWKPTTLHFIIGGVCIGILITVVVIVIACCCICRRRRSRRGKQTDTNGVEKQSKERNGGKKENIEMKLKYDKVKTNSDQKDGTNETCVDAETEDEPNETSALREGDACDEGEKSKNEGTSLGSSESLEGDPPDQENNPHVVIAEPDFDLSSSDSNSTIEPIDT